MRDWEALQQTIAGEVLTPESPGYEAARKPAIARFHDVRPQAVVRCRAAEDVIEAIAFAGGVPVAARSGGHCFAGRSTTTGMVIDVGPLDSVSVSDGVATIGAGARLGASTTRCSSTASPSPPAADRRSGSRGSRSAAGSGSWAAATG